MRNNPIVFWELASYDMEKSAAFFRDVFEWDIEMDERLGFYIAPGTNLPEVEMDGGIFTLGKAKLPFLTLYIQVNDIDVKADLIAKKGGFIVEAPFRVSEHSRICLFNEPCGVTFAMIESNPEAS